jgi:hypothetical protein
MDKLSKCCFFLYQHAHKPLSNKSVHILNNIKAKPIHKFLANVLGKYALSKI